MKYSFVDKPMSEYMQRPLQQIPSWNLFQVFCDMKVLISHQLGVAMDRIDMSCLEQLLEKALLRQDRKDVIEVVFVCLYFSLCITHPVPDLFSTVSHVFGCLKFCFHSEHLFASVRFWSVSSILTPPNHCTLANSSPQVIFVGLGFGLFFFPCVIFLILFLQSTSISFYLSPYLLSCLLLIQEIELPLIKQKKFCGKET